MTEDPSPVRHASQLRMPTIAVPIRLAVVGREPAPAELFVADVPRSGRSELVDDVAAALDDALTFVPVRGDSGVVLLAKHAIAWVAIGFEDSPSEVSTLYDRQHRVEIVLAGGGTVTGAFLDSLPADRPRVVDHLNRAGRFVRVWSSDTHYLVNALQIVEVRELPDG